MNTLSNNFVNLVLELIMNAPLMPKATAVSIIETQRLLLIKFQNFANSYS